MSNRTVLPTQSYETKKKKTLVENKFEFENPRPKPTDLPQEFSALFSIILLGNILACTVLNLRVSNGTQVRSCYTIRIILWPIAWSNVCQSTFTSIEATAKLAAVIDMFEVVFDHFFPHFGRYLGHILTKVKF